MAPYLFLKTPSNPTPPGPTSEFLQAVRDMGSNEWLEVSATNSLTDSNFDQNATPAGRNSTNAKIIRAWGTGAIGGSTFYITGGGHADYNGNEVYGFSLVDGTWSRLNDPTADAAIDSGNNLEVEYPNGDPVSRHGYNNLICDTSGNLIWVQGASLWDLSQHDQGVRSWAPGTDTWTTLSATNSLGGVPFSGVAGLDAAGDIWYQSASGCKFSKFVIGSGWTHYNLDVNSLNSGGAVGGCDTVADLFIYKWTGGFHVWDTTNPTASPTPPTESGNADLVNHPAHGMSFRTVDGFWYAWNGGDPVYRYDIDGSTAVCTKLAPTGNTPGAETASGTWGRWRYWETEDRFVVIPNESGNVCVYRP